MFSGVPAGRVTVGVHLPGFSGLHREVVVPLEADLDLRLDFDLRFAEEVVVSAAPWALRPLETSQQTDQVAAADVRRERVASVGEALARSPGVAFIPTGNAMGTPVIRGISENRIRVLNDGVPLNHQQFSWRHSPNVEPGFAERLELVRGPASVLHGPEAMGGVINLVQAPLPHAGAGRRVVHGEVSPGYSTNSDEWAGQARLEGALGGFGWRGEFVRREGRDIVTPRGTLDNTDFAQANGSVLVGLGGAWGSARLRWHHWENETGFYRPVGFRLGLDDDLVAGDVRLATGAGALEFALARQRNHRQAFEQPGRPATTDLVQDTTTARAGLQHRDLGVWRGRVGFEYQAVENTARAGTLVPPYETKNVAAMVFEEARFVPTQGGNAHRLILSLGLRADIQDMDVVRPTGTAEADYGAVTGAVGAVLRLHESLALAGSLGRGWRAPTPFELYAFGVHGGVAAFQVGNPALGEESNLNGEVSLRYQGASARAALTVFRNVVDNYVYLADSGRLQGPLPVFEYRQADAVLQGIEASAEIAPRPWVALSLAYGQLDTRNELTGLRLPQTPPDRVLAGVRLVRPRLGPVREASVGFDASWVAKGEISGRDEPLGTPTASYEVVDVRAGVSVPRDRTTLDFAVVVRNLLDREYRDFLWSYKPFAPNPGRDVRLTATWRFCRRARALAGVTRTAKARYRGLLKGPLLRCPRPRAGASPVASGC